MINRCFHRILNIIVSKRVYQHFVHLPEDITPLEIRTNPKLYPYFKDARGATDGSHFDAFVPESDAAQYCNQKGHLTQNVLAACTFGMQFCYICSGWEGSAADGRIWEECRHRDFAIPDGRYYLGDAGFPLCDALLIPYRGVRYHLKEWERGNQR